MNIRDLVFIFLISLASCSDYPRDPESTLDRIRGERSFRVGLVAPLGAERREPIVDSLVARVAQASAASPRLEVGDMESLFDRLEQGELDMVVGRFEAKSPWTRYVSFGPPLRVEKQGKTEFHLTAAMRNGENAWIALVERETRNIAEPER